MITRHLGGEINAGPCSDERSRVARADGTAFPLAADIYNQRLTSVMAPGGAVSVVITAQMMRICIITAICSIGGRVLFAKCPPVTDAPRRRAVIYPSDLIDHLSPVM